MNGSLFMCSRQKINILFFYQKYGDSRMQFFISGCLSIGAMVVIGVNAPLAVSRAEK